MISFTKNTSIHSEDIKVKSGRTDSQMYRRMRGQPNCLMPSERSRIIGSVLYFATYFH